MSIELISCPACNGRVSSQAHTCPHCGHPVATANDLNKKASPTVALKSSSMIDCQSRVSWSPMGAKQSQGPVASYRICNIPLTQEAILQKIRFCFEQHGLIVKQSEYRDGTATTGGILLGGDGPGLVGGLTVIDKNTWNPFLVSVPGLPFLVAEVTILSCTQKNRTISERISQSEQDIELIIKIKEPDVSFGLIVGSIFAGVFLGFIIGIILRLDKDGFMTTALICSIIIGFGVIFLLPHLCWNTSNIQKLQNPIEKVVLQIHQNLI